MENEKECPQCLGAKKVWNLKGEEIACPYCKGTGRLK